VAILRRCATLLVVEDSSGLHTPFLRLKNRNPGESPAELLRTLLESLPPQYHRSRLTLALSLSDLACGDSWTLERALPAKTASKIQTAMCETRCASETLESLAVDSAHSHNTMQAAALDRASLGALVDVARGFNLALITAVPAALAAVFETIEMSQGGERVQVFLGPQGPCWRAFPVDGSEDPGSATWKGRQIPFEQAPAFAAATCDPEAVPNLLNALPQYRKGFLKRFRDPLLNIGAAAALCLAALGLRFHRDCVREEKELAAARRAETELWARYLPAEEPREGRLLKAMHDRLGELGETSGAEFPSALAFWGELGKHFPDPEALGISLESIDLAPDGGRLNARVPEVKGDPLKNASQLEGNLNQSKKMSARGDYEVQNGAVLVRMRMDYKP
jgi:hypothetical protein